MHDTGIFLFLSKKEKLSLFKKTKVLACILKNG